MGSSTKSIMCRSSSRIQKIKIGCRTIIQIHKTRILQENLQEMPAESAIEFLIQPELKANKKWSVDYSPLITIFFVLHERKLNLLLKLCIVDCNCLYEWILTLINSLFRSYESHFKLQMGLFDLTLRVFCQCMRDCWEREIREYYLTYFSLLRDNTHRKQFPHHTKINAAALLIYIMGSVGVCLDAKLPIQSNRYFCIAIDRLHQVTRAFGKSWVIHFRHSPVWLLLM